MEAARRRGERVGSGSNADLVLLNGGLETLEALGVLIVGPDKDVLLAGGHGERPNAGHDVAHDLARLEDVDEPAVLRLELAVPVDLGVVELEGAVALGDLDVQVVGAGQDFVLERPELGVGADIVDLVDDGLDLGVLIEQDLGYEVLVGEIVITKVEMRWVPSVVISHVTTKGSGKGGRSGSDAPTWPAILKPVGISSWRSSGRMELITSPATVRFG